MLTQEILKRHFSYNRETGDFIRIYIESKCYKRFEGTVAGSTDSDGYRIIRFNCSKYKAHRLAWLHEYGELPPDQIDHINGIKNDNRITNLRLSSTSTNAMNVGLKKNNTSGYKGVNFNKANKKWKASYEINSRYIYIGYFATPELASIAYNEATKKVFGEFYRAT